MGISILIPIIALCIPIIAILSHTYLKARALENKKDTPSLSEVEELILMKDEIDMIRNQNLHLEEQNLKLEERIKNIEIISANPEFGTQQLPLASEEIKIKAKEKLKPK